MLEGNWVKIDLDIPGYDLTVKVTGAENNAYIGTHNNATVKFLPHHVRWVCGLTAQVAGPFDSYRAALKVCRWLRGYVGKAAFTAQYISEKWRYWVVVAESELLRAMAAAHGFRFNLETGDVQRVVKRPTAQDPRRRLSRVFVSRG